MPKAKPSEQIIDVETDDAPPVERDNVTEIEVVLEAFGEGANDQKWLIKAYRIPDDGGRDIVLPLTIPDPHQLVTIEDKLLKFGSGNYRVVCYRNGQIFKKMIIPVESLPQPEAAPANELSAAFSTLTQTVANMQREQREFMERMTQRLSERNSAPSDPFEQMERMSNIFSNLQGSRVQADAPQTNGLLEVLRMGIELGERSTGKGGDNEPSLLSVAMKMLDSGVLEKAFQPQTQAPTNNPHTMQQRPPEIPAKSPGQLYFENVVSQMETQRQNGADVDHVADWLLGQLPENMVAPLINDPTALNQLTSAFPIIQNNRGFYAGVLNAVRRFATEGAHDDSPNPPANERPSGGEGNP